MKLVTALALAFGIVFYVAASFWNAAMLSTGYDDDRNPVNSLREHSRVS